MDVIGQSSDFGNESPGSHLPLNANITTTMRTDAPSAEPSKAAAPPASDGGSPSSSLADLAPRACAGFLPTTEPLKVCLDDDTSLEGSDDEDMFDDAAFAFGDEDFAALMSHESMRRATMAASIAPPAPRAAAPASAAAALQGPHGLRGSASFPSDKAAGPQDPSHGGDSMPSTAASSIASLGALTLASYASCDSVASSAKKTRSKRRVSLRNDVSVVPIPARDDYPPLIRERIWSSASELYQNAYRNTLEFAAEGFDWRNAADDEQMVRSAAGERIHPVHYMNLSAPEGEIQTSCKAGAPSAPVNMDVDTEPLQVPS